MASSNNIVYSLSLLRYAYTDEQEILSLAGVIAAILDNPDDEYHAYFKELSHLFLTNNIQRFPDAIKKYPASPERKLRLWTKKEYKKSMLYIAKKHLNEMSRITSSMLTPPPGTTALKTKILEAQVLNAVNVYNIELNVYKLELNAYRYYSEES